MDEEVKAEWVKRLRSGDYEQGKGQLRIQGDPELGEDASKDYFCCLGVLCDVAVDMGVGEWRTSETNLTRTYFAPEFKRSSLEPDFHNTDSAFPPLALMGAFGIADCNPAVPYVPTEGTGVVEPELFDGEAQLSALNDEGATFAEIADLIEAHL